MDFLADRLTEFVTMLFYLVSILLLDLLYIYNKSKHVNLIPSITGSGEYNVM